MIRATRAIVDFVAARGADLSTPTLLIDACAVRHNIDVILDQVDGDTARWRPHLKTAKIVEVFDLLLDAGLRRFKCATLREARVFLEASRRRRIEDIDLLVAYPLAAASVRGLAALARSHPSARIGALIEDVMGLEGWPREIVAYLDLDPGMRRTGIDLADHVGIRASARAIDASGIPFGGLHVYEGHIDDDDPAIRSTRAATVHAAIILAAGIVEDEGLDIFECVTSGTPTFACALADTGLRSRFGRRHSVSPGIVVFGDANTHRRCPDLLIDQAAYLLTRVVSLPGSDRITCDAGTKSISFEGRDPLVAVIGQNALRAVQPSEEHLVLSIDDEGRPQRGSTLLLVPNHVCPMINLAESAWWIDGDNQPRPVSVAARAHDI